MNARKILAAQLIAVGVLVLVFGGFTYTERTHHLDVGSTHLSMDQERRVIIPLWMGAGLLVIGVFLLTFENKP